MTPALPLTRDLVLIGGGHTHALVLRRWAMKPLAGVRVTVINPGPVAAYSGMLPGHIAGHYHREELELDLVRLARFAGARVILGRADHIDREARTIHVSGRPAIRFDVASIDIGITSAMPDLEGFDTNATAAKPLEAFASRWASYVEDVYNGSDPPRVAVIGAGVAGAEIAMAMAHRLSGTKGNEVALIDRGGILDEFSGKARDRLLAALRRNRVSLHPDTDITKVSDAGVHCADGRVIPSDFTLGAAGARAYPWLARTGLDLHDGYIAVDAHLQSSDPAIFAVGDCAHLRHAPRPKAGVYAVREAPVLFDNLRAALSGGALRSYHPQKDYLKLISLGGKRAMAHRSGLRIEHDLMWRWKDHIDRKFMDRLKNLPAMKPPALPDPVADGVAEALGNGKPMCGGCGAKVSADVLSRVLHDLPRTERSDVTPLPGDDAARLTIGGHGQVITTDALRALTDDPWLMSRIAATHALGDIWAMGADPQAALAILTLPRMSDDLQEATLRDIMSAAGDVFGAAGAQVVGGHTATGAELSIGFTVTGLSDTPVTLAGATPGNVLILTKPIGTGVIMAAEMALVARGEDVAAAFASMQQSSERASRILSGATAMTDVTGFGLAGHLMNILRASNVAAEISLDAIPILKGAESLAGAGVRSTLFPSNEAARADMFAPLSPKVDLLFDPQTAGGLLAAVDAGEADAILSDLVAAGYDAAIIGTITEGAPFINLT